MNTRSPSPQSLLEYFRALREQGLDSCRGLVPKPRATSLDTNAGDNRLRSSFTGREQSGSILILTALMMVVLMGFVGLVIDVGHRMDMYRQTQNAADAAALAAAYTLYTTDPDGDLPSSLPAGATPTAQLMVQQNGFSAGALQSLAVVDCPASSHTQTECIQASVSYSFTNFFIPVLGFGQSSVGSKAVAEVYNDGSLTKLGGLVQ